MFSFFWQRFLARTLFPLKKSHQRKSKMRSFTHFLVIFFCCRSLSITGFVCPSISMSVQRYESSFTHAAISRITRKNKCEIIYFCKSEQIFSKFFGRYEIWRMVVLFLGLLHWNRLPHSSYLFFLSLFFSSFCSSLSSFRLKLTKKYVSKFCVRR